MSELVGVVLGTQAPALFGALGSRGAELLLGFGAAAVLTLAAASAGLAVGVVLRRRMRGGALAACRPVPADRVREGMPAILEAPRDGGMRRSAGMVRAVHRRYFALAVDTETAPVAIGSPLFVTVADDSAAYRFAAAVTDRRVVDGVPTLYVRRPVWVERVQRRAFHRVPVHLPTAVLLRPAEGREPAVHRAVVQDLSAGGVRLAVPVAAPIGTRLRVRLPVEGLGEPGFEARVQRCDATPAGARFAYVLGCEFVCIAEETREAVLRHCFDVERRQRSSSAPSAGSAAAD